MTDSSDTDHTPRECDFSYEDLDIPDGHTVPAWLNSWECSRLESTYTHDQRCVWHTGAGDIFNYVLPAKLEDILVDGDLHGAVIQPKTTARSNRFTSPKMDLELGSIEFPDGVGFIAANLQGADLKTAGLPDADLRYADLTETVLDGANLTGANLFAADLSRATLPAADLSEANGEEATFSRADLSEAILTDMKLSNSCLEGADLSTAALSGTELDHADLSKSMLSGADLTEASLCHADLSGADLSGADLSQTVLEAADLSGGNLSGADLTGSTLTDADLSDTDLSDAYLSDVDLSGVDLTGASLQEATIKNATLHNATLSGQYMFSHTNAPPGFDLVFVGDLNGSHSLIGASLPADHSIPILKADGVIREWVDTPSDADLVFVDDPEAFTAVDPPAEAEYVRTDIDVSGQRVTKRPAPKELDRDLVFVSVQDHDTTHGPSEAEQLDILGGIDFADLTFTEIDPAEHSELISPTALDRPQALFGTETPPLSRATPLFGRQNTTQSPSLRRVSPDFVDTHPQEVAPAYTNATGATFDSVKFSEAFDCSFIDLTDATISDSNLRRASFAQSILDGATLTDVDLPEANFNAATLSNATLDGANLEDANFTDADLSEASLIATDCEGADFVETVLVRADLSNADLVGANLTGAHFFGTRLDGARIDSETQLIEAGPIGDVTVADRCRYDTDAPPDGPLESVGLDAEAVEKRDESAYVIQLQHARNAYRRLEELTRQNGLLTLQGTMFKRRQEMRRKLLKEKGERWSYRFAELQKWVFVYGESFSRVAGISIAIVVLFFTIFLTTGTLETPGGQAVTPTAVGANPILFWETFYHTTSLFFAGNGPLTPTGMGGQLITLLLKVSGPILLALLIFVLGRRAAR